MKHHQGEDFDSAFTTHFEADLPEAINNSHQLVVVATGLDTSTEPQLQALATGVKSKHVRQQRSTRREVSRPA